MSHFHRLSMLNQNHSISFLVIFGQNTKAIALLFGQKWLIFITFQCLIKINQFQFWSFWATYCYEKEAHRQTALGYILGQIVDGKEVVLAYGGRELTVTEKRYSTTEREALAVVDGIKRYQPYLSGKRFFVHTDHGSLSWLMKVRDPTGRLARWALQLQQYDFEIIHRAGTLNGNADALSRRSYAPPQHLIKPESIPSSLTRPVAVIEHPCPQPDSLAKLQREDRDLADIIRYLESTQLPADDSQARSLLLSIDDFYLDENEILCHLWSPGKRRARSLSSQVVIPASLRHEILVACHDDPTGSHFGITKTYEKIRARYYWPNMYKDVAHWCNSCVDCAMKKIPRRAHKAPLLPIPVQGAFDRIAMDALGPFPPSHDGNRYIIVFFRLLYSLAGGFCFAIYRSSAYR